MAGGAGTRLAPMTQIVSKQLLPIYDKPMIYYSLSVLMLAGIRDIALVCAPESIEQYEELLGNGDHFGVKISYIQQMNPDGIAQVFHLTEEFASGMDVCLILGDNLFVGQGFKAILNDVRKNLAGSTVFLSHVSNPSSFGVAEIGSDGTIYSIEEKPKNPKSNMAVTGLYFYSNDVFEKSRQLKPSSRGELEITDINSLYLREKRLSYQVLGRGFAWLDTGTPDGLLEASNYISVLQRRQNMQIAALEEIALDNGWLTLSELQRNLSSRNNEKSSYYQYIKTLLA